MPPKRQEPPKEQIIQEAIAAYKSEHFGTPSASANAHGIRPETILNRIAGKTSSYQQAHQFQQKLSPESESAIERYCIFLLEHHFPLKKAQIREIALSVYKRQLRDTGQDDSQAFLGVRWVDSYLKRHQSFQVRYARYLEIERSTADDDLPAYTRFFNKLEATCIKYHIEAPDRWNMDETGYQMGYAYASKKVVLRGSSIQPVTPGNREWVSEIASINAVGGSMPSYFIFKGKVITTHMAQEALRSVPDCEIAVSNNGWSDQSHASNWIRHFDMYSRREDHWEDIREEREAAGEPYGWRLLLMDGHISHLSLDFIQYCEEVKIIPFCLPPHSTHNLQPLDRCLFSVLKKAYSDKVDEYILKGVTGITRGYFLEIYGQIRESVYALQYVKKSFEAAGIYPINAERILSKLRSTQAARRAATPPQNQAAAPQLLSSPMHPRTPSTESDRTRYRATISHPSTTPEIRESATRKLLATIQVQSEEIRLLQERNKELATTAARAKKKRAARNSVLTKSHHISTAEIRRILDAKAAVELQKQRAKELRQAQKQIKRELNEAEKEALERRKAARSSRAQLRKVKDESIKEMNASKRACKAVEKNLDLAVRKHLQNPTAASDREIKRLERALAETSILFTSKKDAADEAAAEWEAADALLATLLSQPSQEEIDDEDKLDEEEYDEELELDEEEYDEELELDEYIEDFRPLDSVEGVI